MSHTVKKNLSKLVQVEKKKAKFNVFISSLFHGKKS